MTLHETIYKRKSTRGFEVTELGSEVLEDIRSFANTIKPLYPNIKTEFQIVSKDKVNSILPWKAPHNLVVFSEIKDGCYENIGFMYQQLDLYIQSKGIGCCWIGLGKLATGDKEHITAQPLDSNMKFIIFLTFGTAKGASHRDISGFKRKQLSEIADTADERLEPARLAPSGKDMQPWYFQHEGDSIHAYCVKPGIFKSEKNGNINRIDMGCALAHLYVANPHVFEFFVAKSPQPIEKHFYIGSIRIG